MRMERLAVSNAFIWRRVHSLMGLWLVMYLFLHLLTNSQAALWFGEDGSGFVRLVNALESLPYLQVIESVLIAIPLLIHALWGIKRALQAKINSGSSDGSSPALKYSRNRAFTLQRISSWILLVGLTGHVVQMRFVDAPRKVMGPTGEQYFSRLHFDERLYPLAARLHVNLFGPSDIESVTEQLKAMKTLHEEPESKKVEEYSREKDAAKIALQKAQEKREWMEMLASFQLQRDEVVAVSSMPGTGFLLMVRDTFQSPLMAVLYTIFLLAAAFHAFNGFWTFLITWGIILSYRSQKAMLPVSIAGIMVLSFLGLAAIWGS